MPAARTTRRRARARRACSPPGPRACAWSWRLPARGRVLFLGRELGPEHDVVVRLPGWHHREHAFGVMSAEVYDRRDVAHRQRLLENRVHVAGRVTAESGAAV